MRWHTAFLDFKLLQRLYTMVWDSENALSLGTDVAHAIKITLWTTDGDEKHPQYYTSLRFVV